MAYTDTGRHRTRTISAVFLAFGVAIRSSFLILIVVASLPLVLSTRQLVLGVDGGTESIRACFFDAHTGQVVGESYAVPYETFHPQPGWAEQNPLDWYHNLGLAVKGAVKSIKENDVQIVSLAIDTTCCSVVALDEKYEPLRPCLLWMDQRAHEQTKQILDQCKGDPALLINCGGEGPLSAEWMIPKALWIQQNEPNIWAQATICEYQDYINYKLTGRMCASSCNAATRWHWNGGNSEDGRPHSLYNKLGIPELADKLPRSCLPMGAIIGPLTKEASQHMGLPQDIPVVQGGPDAFVGMVGLGCINPGQLCLITGSSHLHCVVTSHPSTAPGTWGAYKNSPLSGLNFAEGGQSSTGSIIRWAKKLFGHELSYKQLDDEASSIPPGSDGLIALETFQGQRTPTTDPLARGALLGLTLSHTRAHIWRALMEAVCFGTRACIEGLAAAGHECDEIVLAGGITRSPLWLQMHADVTGKPVVVCENSDAPLLGCAILASVGAGIHATPADAVKAMVRIAKRVPPSLRESALYEKVYDEVYLKAADAVRPISHACCKR
jgi:ribulose kinase